MVIRAKIEIEFEPFSLQRTVTGRTVNFTVKREDEEDDDKQVYSLQELPAETLDVLCKDFRKRVFEFAGTPDPEVMKAIHRG